MPQYGASDAAQVLSSMRKAIYDKMESDPQVLRDNQCPHAVGLLRLAKQNQCRTALATMSYLEEALHVLRSVDLERNLDLLLTREDVEKGKPAPEIYLLAAPTLEVALED